MIWLYWDRSIKTIPGVVWLYICVNHVGLRKGFIEMRSTMLGCNACWPGAASLCQHEILASCGHLASIHLVNLYLQDVRVIFLFLCFPTLAKLDKAISSLDWLLGNWESVEPGEGSFPSLKAFRYTEALHFSQMGEPIVNFMCVLCSFKNSSLFS